MEFWTVMWITIISGPLDGITSGVPYPSLGSCEAALVAVSDTLPYDHSLLCEETVVASYSIRPKGRK